MSDSRPTTLMKLVGRAVPLLCALCVLPACSSDDSTREGAGDSGTSNMDGVGSGTGTGDAGGSATGTGGSAGSTSDGGPNDDGDAATGGDPEPFRVMTYNIELAGSDANVQAFIDVRRHQVFETITNRMPDLVGFQEASSRVANPQGVTQRDALEELFDGTRYSFHLWDIQGSNNMSVIAVNEDRFEVLESGSEAYDFEQYLGAEAWQRYFDLHALFHEMGSFVHRLSPIRHANWVVANDRMGGRRVVFINSHYETFIGNNNKGAQYDAEFVEFTDVVNDSFGYASRTIAALGAELRTDWGADGVIIVGDFETGDVKLPAQAEYTAAGYTEVYWYLHPATGGPGAFRPVQGIDNIFVNLADFDVVAAEYDEADYTNAASDHKPFYADLDWLP